MSEDVTILTSANHTSLVKTFSGTDMIALSTEHVNVNFKAVSAGIGIGFIEDYKAKMYGGFHRVLTPNQEWSVPIWRVTHVDLLPHRESTSDAKVHKVCSSGGMTWRCNQA